MTTEQENGSEEIAVLHGSRGLLTKIGDTGIAGGWSSGYNKGGGLSGLTIAPEPTALVLLGICAALVRRR